MLGGLLGWGFLAWLLGTVGCFVYLPEKDYYKAPFWPVYAVRRLWRKYLNNSNTN